MYIVEGALPCCINNHGLFFKIFPTTPKVHSNSSENFSYDFIQFSVKKSFQYSRTFAPQVQMPQNQAHAPLLLKSFPKRPRTRSEALRFGGSHQCKTKQTNYLAS
jgi:hypothetical protein